mmetsp:Transcript_22473/g.31314  ORF Transcript_22473/g.31314 Transcript_22473/m.31314 type:complete len:348 (+) Transcript_22473:36-1079(+)
MEKSNNNNTKVDQTLSNQILAPKWEEEAQSPAVVSQTQKMRDELQSTPFNKQSTPIMRVSQLDANRLDTEINVMLNGQFMKIFDFFKPAAVESIKPELMAILDLIIYRLSIYSMDSTYGNMLQNLKYADASFSPLTRNQKIAFGVLTIGGSWLWARVSALVSSGGAWESERSVLIWKIMNRLETAYKVLSLANFLWFLHDGKYVSLVGRLLQMRLVYRYPSVKRQVSFEFLNRQLVWHEFTEFLLFFMPLINLEKIKNFFARLLFKPQLAGKTRPQTLKNTCPICNREPILTPYITNCSHVFCYFCIQQNLMIDARYSCPICANYITNIQRLDASQVDLITTTTPST